MEEINGLNSLKLKVNWWTNVVKQRKYPINLSLFLRFYLRIYGVLFSVILIR